MWDRLIHTQPWTIAGGETGDVACDSYHQWHRDVQMVHEMGLKFYRFSISWPRLLPNAFPTKISESGKKYYNNLINALLDKGIEPIVTLYHWDLPQKLQDLGGWTNPLITDWFADYATVVFSLFADRVTTWITINEPNMMCDLNYNLARFAPMILEPEMAGLLCNKHVLVAHAKAWRIYDKLYKPTYHGKMSIANQVMWIAPKTADDEEIAEFARQGCNGLYSHAIYSKEGGWPPSIEKAMARYSKKAGYARSKLPAFTKEEILLVRGAYDFYGINYYTARLARRTLPGEDPGVWFVTGYPEFNITLEIDPKWKVVGHAAAPSYPEGLRKNIAWLRKQYGDLDFFITENGCGTPDFYDHQRMEYIHDHLEQVLLSIHEDGANITAYTYWTLMDNFEWLNAYTIKFGLYEVDFADPKRIRTPRASAHYYSRIISENSLDVPYTSRKSFHTRHHHHKTRNSGNISSYDPFFSVISVFLICIL
ncbi:myrosinase 1-like [Epargyreus clarus]|uniref:myrosinase 1-like n=1 Tax=Epargyreus clarus TaxID=520877 RepID=UPI003C2CE460